MSSSGLVACPCCARHVRHAEPRCPFCGGEIEGASPPIARAVARGNLTRKLIFAGAAFALAACADDEPVAAVYAGPPAPQDQGGESAPPPDGQPDPNAPPDGQQAPPPADPGAPGGAYGAPPTS